MTSSVADTESKGRTFGWVVRRLLLYIGLAFASLTVFALFFALTIKLGLTDKINGWFKGGWIGFLVFHRFALLGYGAAIETTLATLEFLARHHLSADDSLPCVRRHLTGISGLARDLVLAHYRCGGWHIRCHASVVVSGKASQD